MDNSKVAIQSLTIQSAIVMALVTGGKQFGVDFDEGNITELITVLIQLSTIIGVVYGRIRAKDVIR